MEIHHGVVLQGLDLMLVDLDRSLDKDQLQIQEDLVSNQADSDNSLEALDSNQEDLDNNLVALVNNPEASDSNLEDLVNSQEDFQLHLQHSQELNKDNQVTMHQLEAITTCFQALNNLSSLWASLT